MCVPGLEKRAPCFPPLSSVEQTSLGEAAAAVPLIKAVIDTCPHLPVLCAPCKGGCVTLCPLPQGHILLQQWPCAAVGFFQAPGAVDAWDALWSPHEERCGQLSAACIPGSMLL